jgi:hypothetical protein
VEVEEVQIIAPFPVEQVVLEVVVVVMVKTTRYNWNSRNSKYWWWGRRNWRPPLTGSAGGKGVVILSVPTVSYSGTYNRFANSYNIW